MRRPEGYFWRPAIVQLERLGKVFVVRRGLFAAAAPLSESGGTAALATGALRSGFLGPGGLVANSRSSVKSCHAILAIRRAVARIAVLAFLPRARFFL